MNFSWARLSCRRQLGWTWRRSAHTGGQQCGGCASIFQERSPNSPGYNPPSSAKTDFTSVKVEQDRKIQMIYEGLGPDKKAYLNGTFRYSGDAVTELNSAIIAKNKKLEKKSAMSNLYCKWCRDSIHSQKTWFHIPAAKKSDILGLIPRRSTVVHVFDSIDFPSSVDVKLLDWADANKCQMIWVMNRCHILVSDAELVDKRVKPYVDQELYRLSNGRIGSQHVFCIDSKLAWGIENLHKALGEANYVVGYSNVGKSTLAHQLANKYQKRSGNLEYGGKTWANPFITQQPTTYELDKGKFVTDMPSFPESDVDSRQELSSAIEKFGDANATFHEYPSKLLGAYGVVQPKTVRKLTDGVKLLKSSSYNCRRVVATRASQVISIGGVVALKQLEDPLLSPSQCHLIAWALIPDNQNRTRVLSSLEKVQELNQSLLKAHELWTIVRPELGQNSLQKVMDVNFKGEGASIAIRGIGMVHVHAYGKIPSSGINLEVYALPNIKVQRRTNILPYLMNPANPRSRKASCVNERK